MMCGKVANNMKMLIFVALFAKNNIRAASDNFGWENTVPRHIFFLEPCMGIMGVMVSMGIMGVIGSMGIM